jgi:hypothetical protein
LSNIKFVALSLSQGNSAEMKRGESNKQPGGVNERSPKSQNRTHQKQKVMARPSIRSQIQQIIGLLVGLAGTDKPAGQTRNPNMNTERSPKPEV